MSKWISRLELSDSSKTMATTSCVPMETFVPHKTWDCTMAGERLQGAIATGFHLPSQRIPRFDLSLQPSCYW